MGVVGNRLELARAITPSKMAAIKNKKNTSTSSYHKKIIYKISINLMKDVGEISDGQMLRRKRVISIAPPPPVSGDKNGKMLVSAQ